MRNLIDYPVYDRIKLKPQFKHALQWDQLLISSAGAPQIRKLHAFVNGCAVVLVGEFVRSLGRIQALVMR
jgi:hypothetical protein